MRAREWIATKIRGRDWHYLDGFITFRAGGFVSAPSPALLLARHNYEVSAIEAVLGGREFSRSLEVGCGYGRLSPAISKHSKEHHAVDINNEALALARRVYPDILFHQASATALPFPADDFDLVTTWTAIQHIPPGRVPQAAEELLRVLRPGGVLLMCEATRYPDSDSQHIWDRDPEYYRELFPGFLMTDHGYIEAIDRIPGLETPGRVMSFVAGD